MKLRDKDEIKQTPKYMTDTKGKVRRRNSTLVSHDFEDGLSAKPDESKDEENKVKETTRPR